MAVLRKRHLAKAISYRLLGSGLTMIVALLLTGSLPTASLIGIFEFVTKLLCYYIHERIWYRFKWGVVEEKKNAQEIMEDD